MTVNSWPFCSESQSTSESATTTVNCRSSSSSLRLLANRRFSCLLRVSQLVNKRSSCSSSQSIRQMISTIIIFLFKRWDTALLKKKIEVTHTHQISHLTHKSTNNPQNLKQKIWITLRSASSLPQRPVRFDGTQWVRYNGHQKACVVLFNSLHLRSQHQRRWIYYIQRYGSKWHGEKRWRTTVNVGLSRSQPSPPSPQTPACPSARRRQWPPASEPAANQDAPINKDSKSSNPRSLKQHTLAEPISLCCFCFCSVLRNRPFHHTNLQVSPAPIQQGPQQGSQQGSHSRNFRIYLLSSPPHLLFSHLFLHVYRICFGTSSASHGQAGIWAIAGGSLRNADRSGGRDSRFGTKLGEEERIVLRACLGISIEALSYQRESISGLVEAWHTLLLLAFGLHVDICFLDQISSLCYLFPRHAPDKKDKFVFER